MSGLDDFLKRMYEEERIKYNLPETATEEEIKIERARREVLEFLNRKTPNDASWEELYDAIVSLDNKFIKPAIAAVNWIAAEMIHDEYNPKEVHGFSSESLDKKISDQRNKIIGLTKETELKFKTLTLAKLIKELEKLDRKQKLLAEQGQIVDETWPGNFRYVFLSCGYFPQGILDEVQRELLISEVIFPIKTCVSVAENEVIVDGKEIYSKESEKSK